MMLRKLNPKLDSGSEDHFLEALYVVCISSSFGAVPLQHNS